MNPIKKAIDEIRYSIPREVLNLVFHNTTHSWRNTPVSLEEQITNKVIRARVMVDCDLVGGDEVFIDLSGVPQEMTNTYTTVYYIPKERTQNRTITAAIAVSYITSAAALAIAGNTGYDVCSVTPSLQLGQAMMNSHMPIPPVSTAKVQLIGENTIMVRDTAPPIGFGYLRCILSNDEALSHLQLRSIPVFCDMCVLAVKAYIYNEYIVTLDKGQLYGGQEIGVVRQIIEGYSDANELYRTFLTEKWTKVAFMNDRETFERFLKLNIGGMR
jgi:hypothetical protein